MWSELCCAQLSPGQPNVLWVCLQGLMWSARGGGGGNVYWLHARTLRLFFQDLAPKAG